MKSNQLPFNITLLHLSAQRLEHIKPITSLDIYQTVGGDLHEGGLFSPSIFGRVGSPERSRRFSYIPLNTTILHPFVYRTLVKLKALYEGILTGRLYAHWDEEKKDFVKADALDGETGYHFFMSHYKDIDLTTNKSVVRSQRVELLNKYRRLSITDKIIVLPAGVRDIEIDASGRTVLGDINTIYLRIIGIARTISPYVNDKDEPVHDLPRMLLQKAFNDLYQAVENMLTGKHGFIQDRWASRRVINGTRNVITTNNIPINHLGSKGGHRATDTILGLFQAMKAMYPVTIHTLRNGILKDILSAGNGQAYLTNAKTLKRELVSLDAVTYDRWATIEGIGKVINSYRETSLRDRPVRVGRDHYMALLYRGPDKTFRVFYDIDDLPKHLSKADVTPINLCEYLYLAGYRNWNNYAGFVTRYPITGIGSSYPTTFYVQTTIVSEVRKELGEDWLPIDEEHQANEFPVFIPKGYIDSQIIPTTRLELLGADFDGDTCSASMLYSEQGVNDTKEHLRSRSAWIDPRGDFKASVATHTVNLVAHNITGFPEAT